MQIQKLQREDIIKPDNSESKRLLPKGCLRRAKRQFRAWKRNVRCRKLRKASIWTLQRTRASQEEQEEPEHRKMSGQVLHNQ